MYIQYKGGLIFKQRFLPEYSCRSHRPSALIKQSTLSNNRSESSKHIVGQIDR